MMKIEGINMNMNQNQNKKGWFESGVKNNQTKTILSEFQKNSKIDSWLHENNIVIMQKSNAEQFKLFLNENKIDYKCEEE